MPTLRDMLVNTLETTPVLDGRYVNLKCVNYNGTAKIGFFSLVFSCVDQQSGRTVVLKLFDPDVMIDAYRIRCFEKEPEILKLMVAKRRCLQLVEDIKTITVALDGTTINYPCKFFVIEWIQDDIEVFFLEQERFDAETKLVLFRDIVSSIEALHRLGIFHRDSKPDNFRAHEDRSDRIVKAVDMGTAASHNIPRLLHDYELPVGHKLYSSPEAWCGLAGVRELAHCSDYYALGCMLFELFNPGYFYEEQRRIVKFQHFLAAMAIDLAGKRTETDKYNAWIENTRTFKHAVEIPNIAGPSSTVPSCIGAELNQILKKLVHVDLAERTKDLEWVRQRINSAINQFRFDRVAHDSVKRRRFRREQREAMIAQQLQLSTRSTATKDAQP